MLIRKGRAIRAPKVRSLVSGPHYYRRLWGALIDGMFHGEASVNCGG